MRRITPRVFLSSNAPCRLLITESELVWSAEMTPRMSISAVCAVMDTPSERNQPAARNSTMNRYRKPSVLNKMLQ